MWEDHKHGMYDKPKYTETEEMEKATLAKNLLTNSVLFENIALRVINEWKISAEVNLTNPSRNRQAWIGQSSCCYAYKIPEYVTKYGWRLMSPSQQKEANRIADKVIKVWEGKQKRLKNTALKMFMKQAKIE
jgi:hypothetical protein